MKAQPKKLMRMLNFANQVNFLLQFRLLSSVPDDTNQQILFKLLLLKTAQLENSTRIFNFAKKVRFFLRVFSILSYGPDIYSRQ